MSSSLSDNCCSEQPFRHGTTCARVTLWGFGILGVVDDPRLKGSMIRAMVKTAYTGTIQGSYEYGALFKGYRLCTKSIDHGSYELPPICFWNAKAQRLIQKSETRLQPGKG